MFLRFIIILIFLLVPFFLLAQPEVTVTGNWVETIDVIDLQGGAGSALNDTYESAVDQVVIDIKGKKVSDWILYVKRIDNTWNSDFRLSVRRTDDGIGSGPLIGGSTYQEITTTDKEFFRGGKNRRDIDAQLKLNLLADVVDTGIYDTTVMYTVTAH